MSTDLDARLADAKQQLIEREQLKNSLSETRERLGKARYDATMLEACLASIEADVKAFDSVSLASLWDTLAGRREAKLKEKREEAAALHTQAEERGAELAALEEQVQRMEERFTALADLDRTFQLLCEEKTKEAIQGGGAQAERLRVLVEHLAAMKVERQRVEKTIQIGKHVQDRLRSMSSSVDRARHKGIHSGGVGALVSTAVTVAMQKPAGGSVDRAVQGLEEFAAAIAELSHGASHRDTELIRLATVVKECAVTLAGKGVSGLVFDYGASGPGVEVVQEALGHLADKAQDLKKHIAGMESERIGIIGSP